MKKAITAVSTLALAMTLAMPMFAKAPKAAKAQDSSSPSTAQTNAKSGKKHHKMRIGRHSKKNKNTSTPATGSSTATPQQ